VFASRPKVSFDQMAAPVPEIMDGSLYDKVRPDVIFHIEKNI
jgi:hypothetical protein